MHWVLVGKACHKRALHYKHKSNKLLHKCIGGLKTSITSQTHWRSAAGIFRSETHPNLRPGWVTLWCYYTNNDTFCASLHTFMLLQCGLRATAAVICVTLSSKAAIHFSIWINLLSCMTVIQNWSQSKSFFVHRKESVTQITMQQWDCCSCF